MEEASRSFAPENVRCISRQSGTPVGDNSSNGWTSGLIGIIEGRGFSDEFETTSTPDQMLVLVTKGLMKLEFFAEGRWRSALRKKGSVARERGHYAGSLRGARLKRLLDFMRVHFAHDISIERLAAEAGFSPFHFIRAFKASVGISPHRYLVDLRLEQAAALIEGSERSIAAIAVMCGFSSAAHLSKAFVNRFERTPSNFRKSRVNQTMTQRAALR